MKWWVDFFANRLFLVLNMILLIQYILESPGELYNSAIYFVLIEMCAGA